jgi:hypothetical protein
VDRLVYTTITLISVLIIYDGWNSLSFWGVLAVILGPILAIFLSHLFGAELGTRVALGRALTWRERRAAFLEGVSIPGHRRPAGSHSDRAEAGRCLL